MCFEAKYRKTGARKAEKEIPPVACQGADHQLYVNSGAVSANAVPSFSVNGWAAKGGNLVAGRRQPGSGGGRSRGMPQRQRSQPTPPEERKREEAEPGIGTRLAAAATLLRLGPCSTRIGGRRIGGGHR